LRENNFRIAKKLTKKSPAAQNKTARPSKKRHQFVRKKYKMRVNARFNWAL
jgi:hypothetical protein